MIDSKLHRERASLAIYAGASRFLRAATFLFRRAAGSTIARRHFVIHERRADRFPVIKHLRRNSGGPRSVLGLPAASRSCISAAVGLGGQSPACCRSSVVEHSLGKGEVESSILSGSTSFPIKVNAGRYRRTAPLHSCAGTTQEFARTLVR